MLKRDASTPLDLPTHYALSSKSVGYQALQREGWSDIERGLGREEQGGKKPLRASDKQDKLGIGLRKLDQPKIEKRRELLDHQQVLKKAKRDQESWRRAYAQVKGEDDKLSLMYR